MLKSSEKKATRKCGWPGSNCLEVPSAAIHHNSLTIVTQSIPNEILNCFHGQTSNILLQEMLQPWIFLLSYLPGRLASSREVSVL